MRKSFLVLAAVLVAACGRRDDEVKADSPAAAAMPAALTIGDFAGRWSIQFLSDMSDSVLATYELNATSNGTGWMLKPSGGEPIPVGAAVEGDSLLFDVGTYKSTVPPAVETTTHGVTRLEGGVLVGKFETRYSLASGDSVVRGRLRGTRMP